MWLESEFLSLADDHNGVSEKIYSAMKAIAKIKTPDRPKITLLHIIVYNRVNR